MNTVSTAPIDRYSTTMEPGIAAVFARRDVRDFATPYQIRPIAEIAASLDKFFADVRPGHRTVNIRRVAGGASKEMFLFDLVDSASKRLVTYVLRMDPSMSAVETCRAREAEICNALTEVVPVPRVPWLDADGSRLGAPSLIMELASGVTQTEEARRAPGGIGFASEGELNKVLAAQFVDNLAAIHAFDWQNAHLRTFQAPVEDPYQAARWQVNWWSHVWQTDAVLHSPAMAAAEIWLRENLPACTDPVVVHGDYRSGNYMFDPTDGRFTAVLDWEAAHLGDFHEDLGETMPRAFGGLGSDGQLLVSGLMPRDQFLEQYERRSGRTVDPKCLHFYEVLACYKCAALCLAAALRTAVNQQNHQDIHQTWLVSAGHAFADELFELIQ